MAVDIPTLNTATTLTLGTVSIAWAIRLLWRRLVKDGTEVAKDRAEINIIDTLQKQINVLAEENIRLRTTESELAIRLGRLEAKEKEASDNLEMVKKLQNKLDEKDAKIEDMIKKHAVETTKLTMVLATKEKQIQELYERIVDLERRLKVDEIMMTGNTDKLAHNNK